MSKIRRGGHSAEGETLSAGRVEYLEAARARVRTRRIRRTVVIVAVLTILVLFATGAVGSSIARAKDLVDTAVIALAPAAGWPQQTGITDPDAVAQMSGSFVEMGGDSCVVYSLGGTRLNSIQSGYARPAIAAGKTRFVLYNRSGNELRVESRTQNLYTKTMDSTISLCAVADAGQVAVVTDSTDSVAKLTVYNSSMQQQLVWNLTSEQGTPLRMAFAPDSRRLAVAAVSAVGGQLTTNLYVLPLSQGDPVCLGSENSVPQWMGWMSNGFLLVLYENRAVLYNTSGGSAGERASYDFGGGTLVSVSNTSNGAALLLSNGQTSTAVLLDGIAQRIEEELGRPATLVVTGGLAKYVTPLCRHPLTYDPELLMKGLALLYQMNAPQHHAGGGKKRTCPFVPAQCVPAAAPQCGRRQAL